MAEKYVGLFREFFEDFNPDYAKSLPRMADRLSDSPQPHESKIVEYLNNGGKLGSMTDGRMIDMFTGETTNVHDSHRSDGEYGWGMGLAYYVEKYHLRLPEDFVQHILLKSGKQL